jgi:type I restriction enzyme R subunit
MAINLFGRQVMFEGREGEIEDDADRLNIPIHAFDFVVADECHRGYTAQELSLWRKTLDHFDAIKLGLTATPAAHTTTYFHNVVYRYDYERAVREGFLVDYDVITIRSNVRMNGVFLEAGEQVGVVDSTSGQQRFDVSTRVRARRRRADEKDQPPVRRSLQESFEEERRVQLRSRTDADAE